MFNFLKSLITGRTSHETFMRRASEMFMLALMQDHAPNDLNAIAIKAHPDFWQKELMDSLDREYKIISNLGNFNEQKLALRSAALDNFDMVVLCNTILQQKDADVIHLGKIFAKSARPEDTLKYFTELRTLCHFSTLSFLNVLGALGDEGEWLDWYKPAIELAIKCLIDGSLENYGINRELAVMSNHAADGRKMAIISGKYDLPENISESNLAGSTP